MQWLKLQSGKISGLRCPRRCPNASTSTHGTRWWSSQLHTFDTKLPPATWERFDGISVTTRHAKFNLDSYESRGNMNWVWDTAWKWKSKLRLPLRNSASMTGPKSLLMGTWTRSSFITTMWLLRPFSLAIIRGISWCKIRSYLYRTSTDMLRKVVMHPGSLTLRFWVWRVTLNPLSTCHGKSGAAIVTLLWYTAMSWMLRSSRVSVGGYPQATSDKKNRRKKKTRTRMKNPNTTPAVNLTKLTGKLHSPWQHVRRSPSSMPS